MGTGQSKDSVLRAQNNLYRKTLENLVDSKVGRRSQEITHLILPGGGLCSLASVYALEYLRNIDSVRNIAASSFSSIVALLYCLGLAPLDIEKEVMRLKWDDIFATPCDGLRLQRSLGNLIKKYTNDRNYTIGSLYRDLGFNLVITAVNVSTGLLYHFNHMDNKDTPLKTILAASCSIPYTVPPTGIDYSYYVDSSLVEDFHKDIFDVSTDQLNKDSHRITNPDVLIIRFIRDVPIHRSSTSNYAINMIDIATKSRLDTYISIEDYARMISVCIPGYQITRTDIGKEELISIRAVIINTIRLSLLDDED